MTSSMPAWLADNLLVIVTVVLALIAFAIAWVLRRAARGAAMTTRKPTPITSRCWTPRR
ncbi:hypothetical protein WJ978_17645 [Achromobacter xylosoxidans]